MLAVKRRYSRSSVVLGIPDVKGGESDVVNLSWLARGIPQDGGKDRCYSKDFSQRGALLLLEEYGEWFDRRSPTAST